MSPMLSQDEIRTERGWQSSADTERALLKRARDAARLELRGESYSAEDRADVAADILTATLAALPTAKIGRRRRARIVGSSPYRRACAAVRAADERDRLSPILPSPTDTRVSLTVFCGRAANHRVTIDRRRKRDERAAELDADRQANSIDGLAADAEHESDADRMNAQTADEARALAHGLARRLSDKPTASLETLLYSAARTVPSGDDGERRATVCAELELSPSALDKRAHDARAKLAATTDATSLLRTLTGGRPAVERAWRTVPYVLTVAGPNVAAHITVARLVGKPTGWLAYSAGDLSRAAVGHADTPTGRILRRAAGQWREGTDGGQWPERITLKRDADDAERETARAEARARCKVRRTRKLSAKLAAVDAQTRADALANLGRALQPTSATRARRWTPTSANLPPTVEDIAQTREPRATSTEQASAAHARNLAAQPINPHARDWLTEPRTADERRKLAREDRKRQARAARVRARTRTDGPLALVLLTADRPATHVSI